MKTSVIEVHDMLSVLSVEDVEKRIGEVPGVDSVTVNYAARNATVRFDETRLEIVDIKSAVRQRGYESAAPAPTSSDDGHRGHPAAGETPAPAAPATPKGAPVASAAPDTAQDDHAVPAAPPAAPAGDTQKDKAAMKMS